MDAVRGGIVEVYECHYEERAWDQPRGVSLYVWNLRSCLQLSFCVVSPGQKRPIGVGLALRHTLVLYMTPRPTSFRDASRVGVSCGIACGIDAD